MDRPRPARIRVIAAFLVGAGLLGAWRGDARAEAPSFTLAWQAPAECPDEGYVRGAVEQLLAGGPRATAHVDARAVVTEAAGEQWRVTLTTVRDGASGERMLEAQSCRSLADATALIVALTIDPARVAANRHVDAADAGAATSIPSAAPSATASAIPPPPPVPATPPSAAPTVPPPTSNASPPPLPRMPADHLALLLAVDGDLGTLPKPAYGFTFAAAFLLRWLRLEGYGSYWPSQSGPASQHGGTDSGEIRLITGGARGCFFPLRPLRGTLEIGVCAGLEVGDLHGEGHGVNFPSSADGWWIAGTAGARASWRIAGPFGLALDVGLAVPFVRDTFALDQVQVEVGGLEQTVGVHQAGRVVGRALFGPELRF